MSHPNDESSAPEEVPEPAAEEPAPEPAGPPRPMAPPVTVYGEGTPVVLLHAFPLDSRMWLPQVEALGGYQAIVPDLRGFGAAREAAVEVTSMDLLADDIAELLDERELERAVLCGLSMGGYVALAFARRHPERLGGLVLGDTTREQQPELAERVTETILDQDPRGVAAAQRGMAERPDATAVLGQISVPTLVITGMEDELIAPDESVQMAAEIRDARLIQVPDAGHLVNLEQAELVNEGLLDFLAPLWI